MKLYYVEISLRLITGACYEYDIYTKGILERFDLFKGEGIKKEGVFNARKEALLGGALVVNSMDNSIVVGLLDFSHRDNHQGNIFKQSSSWYKDFTYPSSRTFKDERARMKNGLVKNPYLGYSIISGKMGMV